jgi:hypothetical protein
MRNVAEASIRREESAPAQAVSWYALQVACTYVPLGQAAHARHTLSVVAVQGAEVYCPAAAQRVQSTRMRMMETKRQSVEKDLLDSVY